MLAKVVLMCGCIGPSEPRLCRIKHKKVDRGMVKPSSLWVSVCAGGVDTYLIAHYAVFLFLRDAKNTDQENEQATLFFAVSKYRQFCIKYSLNARSILLNRKHSFS